MAAVQLKVQPVERPQLAVGQEQHQAQTTITAQRTQAVAEAELEKVCKAHRVVRVS